MYVSPIDPTIPHLDESNVHQFIQPFKLNDEGQEESATGYIARDWDKQPLGSAAGTTAFPSHLLLDEKQIRERIEELDRTKTDLVSLLQTAWAAKKWIGLNQDPTNYCWNYAVVHLIMIIRLMANEPFVRLSPYSSACLIKNFQNIGGWGSQASTQIAQAGVASEEYWPQERPGMSSSERRAANMNAIRNGRQYVEGSRANAALHRIEEFWDLRPSNALEKLSCLCIPLPVASGYNRIGHERCSIKATILSNGAFGGIDLDSYTSDGSPDLKSYGINSLPANDAVVPRAISPSNL